MTTEQLKLKVINSLSAIDGKIWDQCVGADDPFVRHGFLSALEDSGSATPETGWAGQHLIVEDDNNSVLAVAPLYLKSHSYGEYVFDWNWADAYERAGGSYYPKLQCSVPFSPVTGNRLLVRQDLDKKTSALLKTTLAQGMIALGQKMAVSSIHATFPKSEDAEKLCDEGFLKRLGQQFHWENNNYSHFDDFLMSLNARKRKAIRKERRAVEECPLRIQTLQGNEITESHWDAFYGFYLNTAEKKWGQEYLTRNFFSLLGERLNNQVVLIMAFDGDQAKAGALNLMGSETLYGRNWGSITDQKFLHFELCYYQAIDFAIQHGLKRVEAGAQGPHKIQRGYLPTPTYSAHWIRDRGFKDAIARFLDAEQQAIGEDMEHVLTYSPFRKP